MKQFGFLIFFFYFLLGFGLPQLYAQSPPRGVGSGSGSSTPNPGDDNSRGILRRDVLKLDTFDVQYFFQTNPFFVTDTQDTLLDGNFSQPDPAFWGDFAFANLGNLGSPLSPLVYESKIQSGFNVGFNSFNEYYLDKDDLKFYKVKKPFVNGIYTQGRTQNDQHFRVEFATEFGKGLSFSINHRRINHIGVFPNQLARNYALNTGFWYHHPKGKYQAFISFNSNSTLHLENGGLDTMSLNAANAAREETIPVNLQLDTTRYQMRKASYVHYFHLRSPVPKTPKDTSVLDQFPLMPADSLRAKNDSLTIVRDSLGQTKPAIRDKKTVEQKGKDAKLPEKKAEVKEKKDAIPIDTLKLDSIGQDSVVLDSLTLANMRRDSLAIQDSLTIIRKRQKRARVYYDPNRLIPKRRQISLGHEFNIFGGFYKFADLNPDTTFYQHLYLFNQGLQYRVAHSGIENSFFITTSSIATYKPDKTQTPRDFLKAGIKHSYNNVRQFIDSTKFSNISVFGNLIFQPIDKLKLNAEAEFFLSGYNAGDFNLAGELEFNLEKIGSLKARALTQAYAPFYIQNKLNISSFSLFNNDFRKTVETNLGGTLAIAKTKTEISFNFQILDNYIYYDTLAIAQQSNEIFSIPQFVIKQNFAFFNVHLDNTLVFQTSNDNILALPKFFSKHNLYFEGKLFKQSLLLRLGLEGIFHTNYRARRYQPLTGQFYNSNEELKYYPQVDPYISVKKDRWRLFFRVQNATNFFLTDTPDVNLVNQVGFRTPDYPIPYRVFRFGLAMILIN